MKMPWPTIDEMQLILFYEEVSICRQWFSDDRQNAVMADSPIDNTQMKNGIMVHSVMQTMGYNQLTNFRAWRQNYEKKVQKMLQC